MNESEILILLFLYQNPKVTTSEIAKSIFSDKITCTDKSIPERARKNIEEKNLRNQDRRVRYYLTKFVTCSLVTEEEVDNKKRFSVSDNVQFGLAKIDMVALAGDEVSLGLGKILLCNAKDGIHIISVPENH